jgi:hypothetical protein
MIRTLQRDKPENGAKVALLSRRSAKVVEFGPVLSMRRLIKPAASLAVAP